MAPTVGVLLIALFVLCGAGVAWGQAVISLPGGQVKLGVGALGQLGAGSLPNTSNNTTLTPNGGYSGMSHPIYGIYLVSQNADGLAPGCYCEGWGVSANGTTSAYAANDDGGNSNVTAVSFTSTATTATSVVNVTSLPALQVTQAYAPASAASGVLFQDTVTLTNNGATTLTDVRYSRTMDWDINPTEFHEYTTIGGLPSSKLLFSNNDGFCTPDPIASLTSCTAITGGSISSSGSVTNASFTKQGPADQGSFFVFGFGSLAPGASVTFQIYYGAGVNEAAALGALGSVGAGVYALGYASNGAVATVEGGPVNVNSGVWAFGFGGVGGTPLPNPNPTPVPIGLPALGGILLGLCLLAWFAMKRPALSHY